ncbi:MAG: RNA polymerase sigma factor [Ilumatobacter sp.]|uniref:RNA polymerase sigma factor n=1 Tax=Ilumatobacter sp. TaxID=1967498 RepID=UPI0026341F66|nr:RNA polymerase sigma factor [Ilumatobacter sp.]MDJ0771323.1 RNA polymerase sigma factor [Ilumatobacter sp.]
MIERAKAGDTDALAHLWRTYQHLLLRYFRGKGMAEPDDLASTVWIEVASSLPRFEGSEHDFRRWLFTIAARRRIDDIRSSKRRSDLDDRNRVAETRLAARAAADEAEDGGALERALAIVRSLPGDQAEAVLLRVIAELSISEIAVVMGRREGAVRVLVHRGLKRLQQHPDVTDPRARTISTA